MDSVSVVNTWCILIILMWMIIAGDARRTSNSRRQNTGCSRKGADRRTCHDLNDEVSCGQHYLSPGEEAVISSHGVISSRNQESCKWKFQTNEDFRLQVTCELSLPKKSGCKSYLLVTDGNVRKSKLCGNIKSVGVTSNTGVLNIVSKIETTKETSNNFKCTVRSHSPDDDAAAKCRCGRINRPRRIVGGSEVKPNEYPWQVALVLSNSSSPFCGGSIVSDSWILTAAHCLLLDGKKRDSFNVVIGEHDWSTALETDITRRLQIKDIIWHPSYILGFLANTIDHDIGLIQLKKPLIFPEDNSVAPVCLPPPHQNYPEENAIVVGWGVTDKVNELSEVLRVAEVTTMANNVCQALYILTGTVTRNMICAGYAFSGDGACSGDSGGPLLTRGEDCGGNCVVVIGVVSWGKTFCNGVLPTVYTRTNRYLDWITWHIKGSNTCQQEQ